MKGFRDFINRGNVIELATAVVIGTAFTAVVTALVTGIINPLISALFNASKLSTSLIWKIPTVSGGHAEVMFGAAIAAAINFIIIAAVVYFAFVLPYSKFLARQKAKAGVSEDAPAPTSEELLTQIRDLLAAQQKQP